MKKMYIIPIFVPHLGCPNDCTFCNQKKISGQTKSVTSNDVRETIEYYLKNFKEKRYTEIAFFGGSFTGIDIEKQEELLNVAFEYIKNKKVDGIRLSTRPDYIDKATLKRLKKYKVKTIELGVQSADDYILKKCKRGHTFEDVKKASKLIKKYGFKLGHQMMVGLPESTRKDEINTAKKLAKLKPEIMRIYPVLVIKGTELEKQYNSGEYEPLELSQTIEICKELLEFFESKKINVIRIGLQNTDQITSPENEESQVIAGPYHPNMRQLVESEYYYDILKEKMKNVNSKIKKIEIKVNPEIINEVIGYKRENIIRLENNYGVCAKVIKDDSCKRNKILVIEKNKYKEFLDDI